MESTVDRGFSVLVLLDFWERFLSDTCFPKLLVTSLDLIDLFILAPFSRNLAILGRASVSFVPQPLFQNSVLHQTLSQHSLIKTSSPQV